jgi:lantibiotic modifying enzyme
MRLIAEDYRIDRSEFYFEFELKERPNEAIGLSDGDGKHRRKTVTLIKSKSDRPPESLAINRIYS